MAPFALFPLANTSYSIAMNRKNTSDPTRVSFRLNPELAAELARQAHEARKSPGQYAREIVSRALFRTHDQEQETKMLRLELAALPRVLDSIRALRADFASSVVILLSKAGKLHPNKHGSGSKKPSCQLTPTEP